MAYRSSFVVACLLLLSLAPCPAAEPAKAAYTPTSKYTKRFIGGFTVFVHPDLVEHPKEMGDALTELEAQVAKVSSAVTGEQLTFLRRVPIFVEWQGNARASAVFRGVGVGIAAKDSNPDKMPCIEILGTQNFLNWTKAGTPYVLLHELGHAYHHLVHGEDVPQIETAYKQAMDRKLYDAVLHADGKKKKAYAATNKHEYFAELTVMYFGKASYFPHDRTDLLGHDKVGFQMVQELWRKFPLPDEIVALRKEGTALIGQKKYWEAIKVLCRATILNPNDAVGFHERAAAFTFVDRDTEAIADFTRAIHLDYQYPAALRGRGAALLRQEKYKDALADFDKAIELKPDYALAYRGRSEVQRKLGNAKEAEQDEQEAGRLEKK